MVPEALSTEAHQHPPQMFRCRQSDGSGVEGDKTPSNNHRSYG